MSAGIDKTGSGASPSTRIMFPIALTPTGAAFFICPKGWTLPNKDQIDNQRDVTSFSPVLGGSYRNGSLISPTDYGHWWSSEASIGIARYLLNNNGTLYTSSSTLNLRLAGFYVRCVQAS